MGRRKKLMYEVLIYITPIYMHIIHLPMQCRAILTFPEANCPGLRLNRFGLFLMVASNLQWCIPPTYVNTSHRFGFWCFFKISRWKLCLFHPPRPTTMTSDACCNLLSPCWSALLPPAISTATFSLEPPYITIFPTDTSANTAGPAWPGAWTTTAAAAPSPSQTCRTTCRCH